MLFKIGAIYVDTAIREGDYSDLLKRLSNLDLLHNFINEQPVYPEWKENIQRMEFLRAVQGTLALEGSEIELKDVERVAKRNEPSKTDRDTETQNALEAYEFIQRWSSDNPNEEISDSVITQIHAIITRDINEYLNEPGQYRKRIVAEAVDQISPPGRQADPGQAGCQEEQEPGPGHVHEIVGRQYGAYQDPFRKIFGNPPVFPAQEQGDAFAVMSGLTDNGHRVTAHAVDVGKGMGQTQKPHNRIGLPLRDMRPT